MKLCEEMTHAMDHSEVAALILMDISKAFDCLPHNLMATKHCLWHVSLCIKLLVNYLRHRKQHLKIGSDASDWMTLLKGVPQGRSLNLFLNDFMYILKHSIPVNYADNNTLCVKGKTLRQALERVRKDTEAAIDWFDNNKMQANPVKFQYMHTSKTEDTVLECKDKRQ